MSASKSEGEGWATVESMSYDCDSHGKVGVNDQIIIETQEAKYTFCTKCVIDKMRELVVPLFVKKKG